MRTNREKQFPSNQEQFKRWVQEMLRVYRDDSTLTQGADFRTRLRNSLRRILSILAPLIILACLVALWCWFIFGHIAPQPPYLNDRPPEAPQHEPIKRMPTP